MFLRSLCGELFSVERPVVIYCDNQGAIKISEKPDVYHKRTKHIEVGYHQVREFVEDGQIVLRYVKSEDMLADMLTKAVKCQNLLHCVRELNLSGLNG